MFLDGDVRDMTKGLGKLIDYYEFKNDSLDKYDNGIIMPNENGVRVYHIDSRLGLFEWSLLRNEFVYKGFTNQYVN